MKPQNISVRKYDRDFEFNPETKTVRYEKFIYIIWDDEMLKYNDSKTTNIEIIKMPIEKFWIVKSNFYKYNSCQMDGCYIHIELGQVVCFSACILTYYCDDHCTNWPFDYKNCSSKIEFEWDVDINIIQGIFKKKMSYEWKESYDFSNSYKEIRENRTYAIVQFDKKFERVSQRDVILVIIPSLGMFVVITFSYSN